LLAIRQTLALLEDFYRYRWKIHKEIAAAGVVCRGSTGGGEFLRATGVYRDFFSLVLNMVHTMTHSKMEEFEKTEQQSVVML